MTKLDEMLNSDFSAFEVLQLLNSSELRISAWKAFT